jgi:hypothetical protein
LLKDDHKVVEKLFKRFEGAGDHAYVEKREIVDRIIEALSVHAAIEEQIFYPVTRATVPATEDIALESLEQHHIVKWVLSELETMDPEHERFDAKVTVLIENVRHHVQEEEQDYFPKVRAELGRKALADLGEALESVRKVAPTHPHPQAPDEPPGNIVAGAAAGVADRVGDTVSGIAQGGVAVAGDVIATVLGRPKPKHRSTGTKAARSTAAKVRADAAHATEELIAKTNDARREGKATVARTQDKAARTARATTRGAKTTARSTERGAAKTAKAAKAGAKGTVTSARTGKGDTAATAKRGATTTGRTAKAAAKNTTMQAKRSATNVKTAAKSTSRPAKGSRAA